MIIDNIEIRSQFPQLLAKVNNQPLIYLDNGATSLKPKCVIETISSYLSSEVANVHRGIHTLSEIGTRRFEETRTSVHKFINSKYDHEIIFTKGTTESINLLASTFAEKYLTAGDEILISEMEHHSNIVPWQMVANKNGAKLVVVPINDNGTINQSEFLKRLSKKTKIVSITHVSNTLGTVNPIKEMIKAAHAVGAKFCVDAAQSIPHMSIDVQDLDCDFLVFSAHKVYGPDGLGVLYGKENLLNELPPYQGGGSMISEVTFEKTTYNSLPNKFEAGTPAISAVIAFKESIDFINRIGFEKIKIIDDQLLTYATSELKKIPGIKIIGEAPVKSGVLSFILEGCHPHDLGTLLDKQGIAIRTGHHCTQPLMKRFGVTATARASFAFYNSANDVDMFINALTKARQFLL